MANNTEVVEGIERVLSESPNVLIPAEETAEYCFEPRMMQWINYEREAFYDCKGNLVSTKTTYYHKPDEELYRIFQDIVMENVAAIETCEACAKCHDAKQEEKEDGEQPEEVDLQVLKLTPKGIALVAASLSGMVTDLNDERFETFWASFEEKMKKNGYVMEV